MLTPKKTSSCIGKLEILGDTVWYPELVFLIVVFFNSADLAEVISNSAVKKYLFYTTTS